MPETGATIEQEIAQLEKQLQETTAYFDRIMDYKRRNVKITLKYWGEFVRRWVSLNNQMSKITAQWTPEVATSKLFHGPVYILVKRTLELVNKIYMTQNSYLVENKKDRKIEATIASDISVAQSSILAIRTKTALAERAPISEDGMPQRAGF